MRKASARDPSTPLSTRLQKWLIFSIGLALIGVGADAFGNLLSKSGSSVSSALAGGELYMVSIGMLFSSAGELLYDRTRLDRAGSWQITVAIATMMFALVPAALLALATGQISNPGDIALWSTTFAIISCAWGIVLILLTRSGR